MSWWEILIIVATVLFVAAVIVASVVRKLQGKSSCCSECGGNCAMCSACAQKEKTKAEKK